MIDKTTFGNLTAIYHTFGCKLNFSETSTLSQLLADRGVVKAQKGETPDIILVNTCSVTDVADKKCRQTIRSYSRRYPDAAILVTGCYAQLKSEEVSAIPGVVIVAGNDLKLSIPQLLDSWLKDRKPVREVVARKDMDTFLPSCSRGDRTRYFLKVQDGCNYFCTYCTIPMARGRSRSGTIEELVAQARKAASEGGREIVITGVNIGDFGRGTSENFFDLIKALDEVDGIERYRISSIEPNLLTDEMIEWVASSRKFMPHFHVPLQCGDDEVLRLMGRHYDTALFRQKMEKIRATLPDAFIGVDLIVGMRGETEDRFENSYRFIESIPISRLHVFTYSERPGTKALTIPHVVSPEEKHLRTRRMIDLSEKKLTEFSQKFVGTVRPVLLEHGSDGKCMSGFTDNYLKVKLPVQTNLDNMIVNVKITAVNEHDETVEGIIV